MATPSSSTGTIPSATTTNISTISLTHAVSSTSLSVFPYENGSSLQVSVIQLLNCLLRSICSGKFNNPTSLGPSIMHGHDLRIDHIPCGAHVILEILPRHLVREIPNVDAPASLAAALDTTTGGRALLLPIFPHENLPSHQFRIVQALHGPIGFFHSDIFHNAASLGSTVIPREDVRAKDLAGGAHVILEVAPGDGPGEVAHVDALVLSYGIFSGVGGFRFRLLRTRSSAGLGRRRGDVNPLLLVGGGVRGGLGCCLFLRLFAFLCHLSLVSRSISIYLSQSPLSKTLPTTRSLALSLSLQPSLMFV
mmetsp:Transcript_23561/g.49860  ORF Transcript_23561/g.49860 Transcript_23561/m.49860 type:complete len:307 (-) Transcript_23561:111-1031(-)